jgi:hypothetical protein
VNIFVINSLIRMDITKPGHDDIEIGVPVDEESQPFLG